MWIRSKKKKLFWIWKQRAEPGWNFWCGELEASLGGILTVAAGFSDGSGPAHHADGATRSDDVTAANLDSRVFRSRAVGGGAVTWQQGRVTINTPEECVFTQSGGKNRLGAPAFSFHSSEVFLSVCGEGLIGAASATKSTFPSMVPVAGVTEDNRPVHTFTLRASKTWAWGFSKRRNISNQITFQQSPPLRVCWLSLYPSTNILVFYLSLTFSRGKN